MSLGSAIYIYIIIFGVREETLQQNCGVLCLCVLMSTDQASKAITQQQGNMQVRAGALPWSFYKQKVLRIA